MKSNSHRIISFLLFCFSIVLYNYSAYSASLTKPLPGDSISYPITVPDNWITEIKACPRLALSKNLIRDISLIANPEFKDTSTYKAKTGQWEEANLDNDPENEIILFTGMKDRTTGYNRLYIFNKAGEHWQITSSITFIKDFQSVSDVPAFKVLESNKLITIENSQSWGTDGYGRVEKQFYDLSKGKFRKVLSILLNTYQANGYEYLGGSTSDTVKVNGTIKVVYSYWINVFNKFFPDDLLPDRYKSQDYVPIDIFDNNFSVAYKWNNDSLKYLPDYNGDKILQAKTEYINQLHNNLGKTHSPFIEDIRREARKGSDLQKYYVSKRGY